MDTLLASFDFSHVNDAHVKDIKLTCMLFQHCCTHEVGIVKGCTVGTPGLDYHIGKIRDGINVQAMWPGCTDDFKFGVLIYVEPDGSPGILPYMNPHYD